MLRWWHPGVPHASCKPWMQSWASDPVQKLACAAGSTYFFLSRGGAPCNPGCSLLRAAGASHAAHVWPGGVLVFPNHDRCHAQPSWDSLSPQQIRQACNAVGWYLCTVLGIMLSILLQRHDRVLVAGLNCILERYWGGSESATACSSMPSTTASCLGPAWDPTAHMLSDQLAYSNSGCAALG